MSRKKKTWTFKKNTYKGFYVKDSSGDRRLDLVPDKKGLTKKSFESPSAAKKAGAVLA